MRALIVFSLISVTFFPFFSGAQNTDTLSHQLDSMKKQTDTAGQVNLTEPYFYNERTTMNAKVFGVLLWDDFKQQAKAPLEIHGKQWWTGAALVGATLGLSFVDKPVQRWASKMRRQNPTLGSYSKTLSDIGGAFEVVPLGTIAIAGYITKSPKLRTTAALAAQAYLTSTFWSTLFKYASGRLRPHDMLENSDSNISKFHGPFYTLPYGSNSAFPSGHSALALAAARVFAMEYKQYKWVPITSYSIAALIGFSRIVENRHWMTDIFAGAILGYACGTQVVNNYHRYARLQRQNGLKKIRKTTYNLGADYYNGMVMPRLVVNF